MRWIQHGRAIVLSVVFGALCSGALRAQRPRNDVLSDLLRRQQLGIPTFGDQLRDVASGMGELARAMGMLSATIDSSRRDYFRSYGNSGGDPQARLRLLKALRARDFHYLSLAVPASPGGVSLGALMDRALGSVGGGLAASTRLAFDRWVSEVRHRLGPTVTAPSRNPLAALELLVTMGPAIAAADSLYVEYAVRSLLEEHARAGVRPVEWPPEAWRLAMLARAAQGRNEDIRIFDPFADGAAAAARGGFRRMCVDSIAPVFGGAPTQTCSCLAEQLASEVPVERQWEAEAADSLIKILAVTMHRPGLQGRLRAACGRAAPPPRTP